MRYRKMPIKDLVVDRRYQRPLDQNRIGKIVSEFDERLLGVLEISQRNGKAAVFDGQHRLAALKKLGRREVPCLVHEDLAPVEEADLFVRLQRERRSIHPIDAFKARLFAAEPKATEIAKILDQYGYRIGHGSDTSWENRVVRSVGAVDAVYARRGPEGLDRLFATVESLWPQDKKSTDGRLLRGLSRFLEDYEDRVGEEEFSSLREEAPIAILRRAVGGMGGGSTESLVCAELVRIAGLRGRPQKHKRAVAGA